MKAGMALLKWDKVDFRKTNIVKEEQNQIELKGEIDKFTFLLGDFKAPFTIVDKQTGMKDLTTDSPNRNCKIC